MIAAMIAAVAAAALGSGAATADGRALIFNGKDLSGWRWSQSTHHGSTGEARIEDDAIALYQRPIGQGGLLLTEKRYKNFDLYLEVLIPPGNNSGIFLRSTDGGSAYQVELVDGTLPSPLGALIGERMRVSVPAPAPDLTGNWKTGQWNSMRVRMEGDVPRVTLWVNGVQQWDVQQTANLKIAGEVDGHIGLQLHWSFLNDAENGGATIRPPWKPGTAIRFRNIAIRELP